MKKGLVLRDVLEHYTVGWKLPDDREEWDDIRPPAGLHRVELAFMLEDETHITTYAEHPMLIPWYDCPVIAFDAIENDTLRIWLEWKTWIPFIIRRLYNFYVRGDENDG